VATEPDTGAIVAVARFVADVVDVPSAEVAVVVADAWQHCGLGSALLHRLTARARQEGVRCFTASVFDFNDDMVALLAQLGDVERRHAGAGVASLRVELA